MDIDLVDGPVRIAGIGEVAPTATGLALHRLPAWARRRSADPALDLLQAMPAGGRLELATTGAAPGVLEIDVQLTLVQPGREPGPAATFDVVIDGEVVATIATRAGTLIVVDPETGAIDIVPGGPTTVRIDVPEGRHEVEIWLPHTAAVQLLALRAGGTDVSPPPVSTARRWVHHGSSISHCFEAISPTTTWPALVARRAGLDLSCLAFAGQCQLDQFTARAIAALPTDLISLELGINVVNGDTYRERTFVPALHGFLDTIRDGHADVPIVVVSPIICPVAEDHPGPTAVVDGTCRVVPRPPELAVGALDLRRVRELMATVIHARQGEDPHLHLIDGLDLFGADDVVDLDDGLHPNAAGYRRMADRFGGRVLGPAGPFADR